MVLFQLLKIIHIFIIVLIPETLHNQKTVYWLLKIQLHIEIFFHDYLLKICSLNKKKW